jgi:hypothetical protein
VSARQLRIDGLQPATAPGAAPVRTRIEGDHERRPATDPGAAPVRTRIEGDHERRPPTDDNAARIAGDRAITAALR